MYVHKCMGQTLAISMTGSMFSSSTFQLLHLNDFEVLRCHAATPKNILCFPVCLRKAACRRWWCPVIFPWFIIHTHLHSWANLITINHHKFHHKPKSSFCEVNRAMNCCWLFSQGTTIQRVPWLSFPRRTARLAGSNSLVDWWLVGGLGLCCLKLQTRVEWSASGWSFTFGWFRGSPKSDGWWMLMMIFTISNLIE